MQAACFGRIADCFTQRRTLRLIAFIEMTVTFAAFVALCLFLNTKTRLPAGLAPLFVLCGTMVWYSVLGSVHLLAPAGVLWFAAALAACVWLWCKHKDIR